MLLILIITMKTIALTARPLSKMDDVKNKIFKKKMSKKKRQNHLCPTFLCQTQKSFRPKIFVKTLIRPKKSSQSQNAKSLDCQMNNFFFQIFFFKSQICLVPIFISKIKFFKILFVNNFFVKNIICKIKFIKNFLSKVAFVKS